MKKNRTTKYKHYRLCFLLLLVGSIILLSCKNDIEEVKAVTFSSDFPSLKVKDLHTTVTDSGVVRIVIDARIMQRFDHDKDNVYDEYPEGIHVRFYKNAKLSSEIVADYAIYNPQKDLWEAQRNVVATNVIEEKTLKTEQLFWDVKKEKIYSEQFVTFITQDDIFYGSAFESDQDFNNVKIPQFKGDFLVSEEDETESNK